jgi:hypothetical protein
MFHFKKSFGMFLEFVATRKKDMSNMRSGRASWIFVLLIINALAICSFYSRLVYHGQPSHPTFQSDETAKPRIDHSDEVDTDATSAPRKSRKDTNESSAPRKSRNDKADESSTKGVVYALARQDRAGSAIAHMLAVHAYAYHHNLTYGGACFRWNQQKPNMQETFRKHQPDQIRMLDGLGLSHILPFNCPEDEKTAFFVGTKYVQDKKYKLWTEPWADSIRSQIVRDPKDPTTVEMAVHVRRQDIKPCGKWAHRYLPNSYFLQQIRENWPHDDSRNKTVKVTIYSTRQNPFEPFDDFSNYTLDLDGDIVETWKRMMTADIFITSKSGFSLVPALLNANGIIVAPRSDSFFFSRWRKANDTHPPIDCSTNL